MRNILSLKFSSIAAQWRRLVLGFIIGSVIATGDHLLNRDVQFTRFLYEKWANLAAIKHFDGLSAYKAELGSLRVAIFVLVAIPTSLWIWKWARAWWAGITSAMMWFVACITVAAFSVAPRHPKTITALGLAAVLVVGITEEWRRRSLPRISGPPKLKIPTEKPNMPAEQRWQFSTRDEPVSEWSGDIIGRAPVVKTLADHALSLRTPIVALHGDLGDGKSSVLNLLREAIGGQAIVVSFSAWLPGSETTLATDLFRDIASACSKYVYVPRLRKLAFAYARTVTGSVSYLVGLRELFPSLSQREEVDELRNTLSRIPKPVVVLLDEIDRMQREELLALLKILRGAGSLPNVTFVCAFSEELVTAELLTGSRLPNDYLEKFFPVSVMLSAPDPDMLATCFKSRLTEGFKKQGWYETETEVQKFEELFDLVWQESLRNICTNFRKANLLLYDVLAAAQPIIREVNPLDLMIIEAIRRFFPTIYKLVRVEGRVLAYGGVSFSKGDFLTQKHKDEATTAFLDIVNKEISACSKPAAAEVLLSWLFPLYVSPGGRRKIFHDSARQTSESTAQDERRICSGDHFWTYFRFAVPQEMVGSTELEQFLVNLNNAKTTDVPTVFNRALDSTQSKHPKREDFLWKLSRQASRFNDAAAEALARAIAERAGDYSYDFLQYDEARHAVNIVFAVAQTLSETPRAQGILVDAIRYASDDTFALRVLQYTQDQARNKILTDFSHIDVAYVRSVFIERMRQRYGSAVDSQAVDIHYSDWQAFRVWVTNSEEDLRVEQDFWRRFIGGSRKRLAQALNFFYPINTTWNSDPTPIVSSFFPTEEIARMLRELPTDSQLDDAEAKGIVRMQDLLEGRYFNISAR